MVKKLHHNASERDRRKKINSLYSSLRSLLPASDHMKKLSIPSTISRVLKYIPELQQQVEKQIQRKEELLSKLSGQGYLIHQENQRKDTMYSSLPSVSASRLGDREVVVQSFHFQDP
ncbi:ACHAETE-SCUTE TRANSCRIPTION FACTOR-RELATED [Salix purpurea]|uniref:ACHAETE-SCUTE TRANSCRIPTION FACTOR-RELATED n=1 Tax=Salix purpurea TaxID=77065 RepID=A0A9Q0Q5I1_SALPP|nr:ACHAETE-SCUTE TRANSCRIPTION FACTOR-RELATED [Salix purpurea]